MEHCMIVQADGEEERNGVREVPLGHALWEPDHGVRAGFSVCHDGQNLYVRLRAKEKEIRAEYTDPPAPVHEDSCLEFFFMPEGADSYLNFEINPNGCLHAAFGRNRQERKDVLPPGARELFRIRTGRTADGWEASYRIPAGFLRQVYPAFGFTGVLKANVYKCGDKTAHPHYLAWNPVKSPVPDFHRPECFGEMRFG